MLAAKIQERGVVERQVETILRRPFVVSEIELPAEKKGFAALLSCRQRKAELL